MPRPKPKNASQNFFTHPKSLKEEDQAKLLHFLGYSDEFLKEAETPGYKALDRTPGNPALIQKISDVSPSYKDPYEAIRLVELAIALGIEGQEHLDNIPRPADHREEFTKLRRAVIPAIKLLSSWSEYYRDQFTVRKHDYHELLKSLAILFDVSNDVISKTKGKSSKGARKNNALAHSIKQLRIVFQDYYVGDIKKRKATEFKFITVALESGRVIKKNYEGLAKLMRDSRCALPPDIGSRK